MFITIFIFAFLIVPVVTAAQVPLSAFPVNDGTKSYYVTGGNGTNIFVQEKGEPSKTTIIFSGGIFTSRTSWDPQWFDPELYNKFHLVRYDYRGIGDSDKPDYGYTFDLNAEDLFAIINKLSSDHDFKEFHKIALVGFSIGTPVSLTFMKNYPNVKIDGLVTVCGAVNNLGPYDNRTIPIFQNFLDPQQNFDKVTSALDMMFKLMTFKPFSNELHSYFLGNAVLSAPEYRKSVGIIEFNLAEFYSTLKTPTLHIAGAEDIFTSLDHSLYFASLRQNSKIIIYKKAGHNIIWEKTKEVNKDLAKFVNKL